jgi:hypothetical protein
LSTSRPEQAAAPTSNTTVRARKPFLAHLLRERAWADCLRVLRLDHGGTP